MGVKFDWGRALSAGGQGLGQLADMMYRQQTIDEQRKYNEEQQAKAWLHQSQMLDQRNAEAMRRQNARDPLMPVTGDIAEQFPEFAQPQQTPAYVGPTPLGGSNGTIESGAMLPRSDMMRLMGMMPEDKSYGEMTEIPGSGGAVGQLGADGKWTNVHWPSAGGSGGKLGADVRPSASVAHKLFGDMSGGPEMQTNSRQVPILDERGKPTGQYRQIMDSSSVDVPGSAFDAMSVSPMAYDVPNMITTSADSVYQANPEMSPYESWQTAYGVHQPRIENLRNQEQAYNSDVQSIYNYLGNQGIESTGNPNDPWKMNIKRKRDKQFTDEQLATWIGDNQKGMGVDQKSLMRFLTDELGIENPLQYITGEDPIINPGTGKAPGAALPDSTMSKSGRPMSRGADGKYYYDD